jgi:hypothetical protein
MKHAKYFTIVPALALLAVAPTFAQETGGDAGTEQEQTQEQRVPSYVKAPIGKRAAVLNAEEVQLGYVIERKSGKVLFVAVGTDGAEDAARLVPYDRFTWDAKQQRLLLPLTPDELRGLPVYDREKLEGADHKARGATDMPREDGADKPGDDAMLRKERKNVASSELIGSAVTAAGAPFATVGELVLEPKQGMVTFVLAHSEDAKEGPYILPWQAMKYETSVELEGESRFTIAWSADKLADAPTLKRGDLAPLKQAEKIEEIFRFYELESPVAKGREPVTRG